QRNKAQWLLSRHGPGTQLFGSPIKQDGRRHVSQESSRSQALPGSARQALPAEDRPGILPWLSGGWKPPLPREAKPRIQLRPRQSLGRRVEDVEASYKKTASGCRPFFK